MVVRSPCSEAYSACAASLSQVLRHWYSACSLQRIGTPLTMDEFAWSKEQAVLYNNIFYAGLAVIAILSFVLVKIVTKWSVS